MPRKRKKDSDFFEIALGIIALVALLAIHPQTRAALKDSAGLALLLMGSVVVTLVVIAVYRLAITISSLSNAAVVAPDQQNLSPNQPKPVRTLFQQLHAIDWFQFEKLMTLAYGGTGVVERKGGAKPDGGIDLILTRQNKRVAIQCKHWKSQSVGVKVVREMIGAMADVGLKRGIIVSLNSYSKESIDLARRHSIELVDEAGVVELLRYLDQRQVQGILSDTKKFCPRCERQMVVRTARNGTRPGDSFWGCLGFPKCRYTLPFESGV